MALLSADDVLNKRFQPTKFREGYDQDEVDDFLDEVVNTLRAVYAENDEVKAKLQAAEERVAELSRGDGAAPEAPQPEAPAVAAEPAAAPAAPAASSSATDATGMLALAQRLHDEYVTNGREEGERIIAEARLDSERIARETEEKRTQVARQLEAERNVLERKIDELRTFEREYRGRMKSYLEGLLADVEMKDLSA